MSDDLKVKIAEAACLSAHPGSHPIIPIPGHRDPRNRIAACYVCQRQADAVLAVVQPDDSGWCPSCECYPTRLLERAEQAEAERDRLQHIATLEREGNEIVEAERDEALAEVARLRAAVEALHHPVEVEPSNTICRACSTARGSGETLRFFPFVEWPCPTTAALLGPDGGSDE